MNVVSYWIVRILNKTGVSFWTVRIINNIKSPIMSLTCDPSVGFLGEFAAKTFQIFFMDLI